MCLDMHDIHPVLLFSQPCCLVRHFPVLRFAQRTLHDRVGLTVGETTG